METVNFELAWLLERKCEIDAINAEIEGMKALNQYRIDRNETIAYDEDAFIVMAGQLRDIANLIHEHR